MIKRVSDYLTRRMSILSTMASSIAIQKGSISVITTIGSPVGDWRSFRDIAEFDIISASKYQRARLYSLQAQRSNHWVNIPIIFYLI